MHSNLLMESLIGLLILEGFLETKLMKFDIVALIRRHRSIKPIESDYSMNSTEMLKFLPHSLLIRKR
jgi:hypothetical protein